MKSPNLIHSLLSHYHYLSTSSTDHQTSSHHHLPPTHHHCTFTHPSIYHHEQSMNHRFTINSPSFTHRSSKIQLRHRNGCLKNYTSNRNNICHKNQKPNLLGRWTTSGNTGKGNIKTTKTVWGNPRLDGLASSQVSSSAALQVPTTTCTVAYWAEVNCYPIRNPECQGVLGT